MLDRNSLILNGIQQVKMTEEAMDIKMKWSTSLEGKDKDVDLHLDFRDPDNCYKRTKSGRIHKFMDLNNMCLIYRNSSISAETFVYLGYAKLNNIDIETHDMCADVKDGSGTSKARDAHQLQFNIHPSNINWVKRMDNFIAGQHRDVNNNKK